MSVLSSGDEYTEDELLQVCEEMGLPFDSENIAILKEAIDELIAESDFGGEDFFLNASLFGSLSLSSSSQSEGVNAHSSHEAVSSPIQRIERSSSRPENHTRQRKEVPLDVPSSQENEEIRQYNPTAYFLLNDAFRCLNSVYGTMAIVEDLQKKLTSSRSSGRSSQRIASRNTSGEASDNKENESTRKFRTCAPLRTATYLPSTTESNASEDENEGILPAEKLQPDPSLRPVHQFVPGKLLYRHDPVKKFELYREEWARKPAPGEEKHLALRWKVREHMLRQNLPDFDPNKPTRPYTIHPKDWSPRPYLD
ncbi:hypothetical protein V3C99_013748 [Haemonchus contortus]|uniref:HYLS1_C domain-containing protein n=1 Tax=Haemonchus contortus TaxID=6289 RepID=A0A7I5EC11_HAECO|nr:Protein HYLS-1, isoform a [Haemonchus contortus]